MHTHTQEAFQFGLVKGQPEPSTNYFQVGIRWPMTNPTRQGWANQLRFMASHELGSGIPTHLHS